MSIVLNSLLTVFSSIVTLFIFFRLHALYLHFQECFVRFSEDFYCEMPKKFSKSHVPGTEMTFIAVEILVSIVFRHVMFCATQAVTSLKIGQNL